MTAITDATLIIETLIGRTLTRPQLANVGDAARTTKAEELRTDTESQLKAAEAAALADLG